MRKLKRQPELLPFSLTAYDALNDTAAIRFLNDKERTDNAHLRDFIERTLTSPGHEPPDVEEQERIWLEVRLAAEKGCKLARCANCNDGFLTGPLTGRRSHAKYCSDRCRVAAMRARQAAA
jgi:hypothetical protein